MLAIVALLVPIVQQDGNGGNTLGQRPAIVARLELDYSLTIVTEVLHETGRGADGGVTNISYRKASPSRLEEYLRLFESEMSLYPKSLIQAAGLKRIVPCRNLTFVRETNGLCDRASGTLYLDTRYCGQYGRWTLHHEFFHLIDYALERDGPSDRSWSRLNPPDFAYTGAKDSIIVSQSSGRISDDLPGFLNEYSTTGADEDRAELFAAMITAPGAVSRLAEDDQIIRRKVDAIKQGMTNFSSDVDSGFWQHITDLKRPESNDRRKALFFCGAILLLALGVAARSRFPLDWKSK